jgi:hypothetical protein
MRSNVVERMRCFDRRDAHRLGARLALANCLPPENSNFHLRDMDFLGYRRGVNASRHIFEPASYPLAGFVLKGHRSHGLHTRLRGSSFADAASVKFMRGFDDDRAAPRVGYVGAASGSLFLEEERYANPSLDTPFGYAVGGSFLNGRGVRVFDIHVVAPC